VPRTNAPPEVVRLTSGDGAKTWGKPEAVALSWPGDAARAAAEPCVVQLEDGRLRLYFLATTPARPEDEGPGPRGPGEMPPAIDLPKPPTPPPPPFPRTPDRPWEPLKPRVPTPPARSPAPGIFSAVSDDGLRFVVEKGVRYEDESISHPAVVRVGDEWLMFLSRADKVLLARSGNGLKFEKDRPFVLRGGGDPGAAVLSNGRIRLYQSAAEGISSLEFDPETGNFRPDPGIRMPAPAASASICSLASGTYAGVFLRRTESDSGPR
jgi:hypothetical protein